MTHARELMEDSLEDGDTRRERKGRLDLIEYYHNNVIITYGHHYCHRNLHNNQHLHRHHYHHHRIYIMSMSALFNFHPLISMVLRERVQ